MIDRPFIIFSNNQLNQLKYNPICETVSPGSCHFLLLAFYRGNPQYRRYWFIEYDVLFTGNWSDLMNELEDDNSDFISCEIEKYNLEKNGNWPWWTIHNDCGYPIEDCVRGFNPICRYSNFALRHLDTYLRYGHSAHSEVMITTALHNAGLRITDFGGNGEFSNPMRTKVLYIPNDNNNNGTIRWKPIFNNDAELTLGMLYHPVKALHKFEKKHQGNPLITKMLYRCK